MWCIGVLPGETACKDVLTVTENSRLLLNKCGDIEDPITVDSFENELNISLSVTSTFQAKRGLLAFLSGTHFQLFPWNSSNSSANSSSSSFWLACSKVRWQVTLLRNWRLFTLLDLCMSAVRMLIEHFSWFQDWAARYLRHPIRVTWFMVTLPGRNSCAALATCFRTRDSAPATSAVWTSRDGVKSMFQDVSVSSSLSFQFGAWATLWFFIFFNFFWQTCTT